MKCKHCGSNIGFYTKLKGFQYYNENAEPQGFDVDTQGYSVYCENCKKRVCSIAKFLKQNKGSEQQCPIKN